MSKIEELIKQYCPDGVEYRNLDKVATTITTGKLNANAMCDNGHYPFFTCDARPFTIDEYAFDMEAILVSGNGSQVGHINYYKGKFNAYQRTYVLGDFAKDVNIRFLFHYLLGYLKPYILNNSKKGSVPYITLPMLQNFVLPVPPMVVQEEIVKILDNFSELTTELTTELTARKQQYDFYRDKLLTFNKEQRTKKSLLKDVVYPVHNIKWKEDNNNKKYIDLSSVDRDTHNIDAPTIINRDNAPSRAQQIVNTNDILFATTRPTLRRFCIINDEYDKQICSTGFVVLRPNTNLVMPKYLYFIVSSTDFLNYVELNQEGTSYPAISDSKVKEYKFNLPSLEVQERIVNVLDNFDKICSDLGIGLPAEIEARQKQYEYYREKLLTFDNKVETLLTEPNRTEPNRTN